MSNTNKIITNIKRNTSDFTNNVISNAKIICIDSSTNRIGINTMTPKYSIDISGKSNIDGIGIKSFYLKIFGNADISDLDASNIVSNDISINNNCHVNNADISYLRVNKIDVSNIVTKDISVNNICDISEANIIKLDVSNIISKNIILNGEISCNKVITNDFIITDFEAIRIDVSTINTISLESLDISSKNIICQNTIKCLDEISGNTIRGISGYFYHLEASFGLFSDINADNIICLDLSSREISCNSLQIGNIRITNDGTLVGANTISTTQELSVKTIDVSDISVNNLTVKNKGDIKTISSENITNSKDISTSNLYIREKLNLKSINEDIITNTEIGDIILENSGNILKVRNNSKWNTIFTDTIYGNFALNEDISGNDLSYNTVPISHNYSNQIYYIDKSDNLLHADNDSYKRIPLKVISNNIIELSNYEFIDITKLSLYHDKNIYDIQANVSVQYLNKTPGDVEVNEYTFGLYKKADSEPSINELVKTKNTVIAFDNSYNYSNSYLNYLSEISDNLIFYIHTNKEINYLRIENFNCSIKLIGRNS